MCMLSCSFTSFQPCSLSLGCESLCLVQRVHEAMRPEEESLQVINPQHNLHVYSWKHELRLNIESCPVGCL
ncbi:hypothetical protein BDR05DRAFT_958267 [Suillus weaverae]|nr:hypothetical protein BDR05DRAFT_958267 [Suillus weaverae]